MSVRYIVLVGLFLYIIEADTLLYDRTPLLYAHDVFHFR